MMIARCSTTASKTAENIYAFDHPVGFYQKMQVVANLRRLLARNHISLQQCSRIIDLGCGDGFMLRMMAELRGCSAGLTGIDLTPGGMCTAHRMNTCITCVRGDIRRLPFANGSHDLMTGFVSFMFLATPDDVRAAADEARRVLKDHGYLLVFDLVRSGNGHAGNRGLGTRGIARQVELAGFKLVDRQPCFRNIFGLKRFCTAYLAARLPTDMLLLLERLPFSPANNIFLLFEKA